MQLTRVVDYENPGRMVFEFGFPMGVFQMSDLAEKGGRFGRQ